MGYVSRHGRRPDEAASKSSHSYIINDPAVKAFLKRCTLPKRSDEVALPQERLHALEPLSDNPIRHIVAIDGGYTECVVQPEFPSATVAFFQFGALIFRVTDLENITAQPFIDPQDMAKLRTIQRLKLTLPIRNMSLDAAATLTHSVRLALYEFFRQDLDGRSLMKSLAWLLFEQYRPVAQWKSWTLASCPHCGASDIVLTAKPLSDLDRFACPHCRGDIYLTDTFRLHEVIDDELGASGVLGYVTTAIEQLILCFVIHLLLDKRPQALAEVLFIKDGPLAYFGQTANLFKPMRQLVTFLFERHNLYLSGLEKSGPFVEHADEIAQRIEPGHYLILDNDYIYRYILPGQADPANPYGRSTYYGNKLIFKTARGHLHLASLPTAKLLAYPNIADFKNLNVVLNNLQSLRCDMYDSALLPIALVNKLVSLADHPSSALLKTFAASSVVSK